jgi:hypothetical protein
MPWRREFSGAVKAMWREFSCAVKGACLARARFFKCEKTPLLAPCRLLWRSALRWYGVVSQGACCAGYGRLLVDGHSGYRLTTLGEHCQLSGLQSGHFANP